MQKPLGALKTDFHEYEATLKEDKDDKGKAWGSGSAAPFSDPLFHPHRRFSVLTDHGASS